MLLTTAAAVLLVLQQHSNSRFWRRLVWKTQCFIFTDFMSHCTDPDLVRVLIMQNRERHCRCLYVATYSQVMSCPLWRDGPQSCICQRLGLLCHSVAPPTSTHPVIFKLVSPLVLDCGYSRTFPAVYPVRHTAERTADRKTIFWCVRVRAGSPLSSTRSGAMHLMWSQLRCHLHQSQPLCSASARPSRIVKKYR